MAGSWCIVTPIRGWGCCRPRQSCMHDFMSSSHDVELGALGPVAL
jgi:hypothetical protein